MDNPLDELQARRQAFISVRELITKITDLHPEMSVSDVAEWILLKIQTVSGAVPELLIKEDAGVPRRVNTWGADIHVTSELLLGWLIKQGNLESPYQAPIKNINKSEPPMDFDDDIPF